MADNRSIVITLKLDNTSENESDVSNQTNTNKDNGVVKDKKDKSIAWAVATRELEFVANEAIAWAEYAWDKNLTLNDDYIGQRNKRIIMTQINRGVSTISSVVSATATGAALGGPAGAAIGALIGTINAGLGIARSNYQGNEQQNIVLRQMSNQLEFTRSRAGYALKAASIGEDL